MDDPTETDGTVLIRIADLEDALDALDQHAIHLETKDWYVRMDALVEDFFQRGLARSRGSGATRH